MTLTIILWTVRDTNDPRKKDVFSWRYDDPLYSSLEKELSKGIICMDLVFTNFFHRTRDLFFRFSIPVNFNFV